MQISPQLPDNIEELKALLSAQFAMVQALEDERNSIKTECNSIKTERDLLKASKRDDSDEINRLKLLISKLQRMLFGQKSEKLERQIDQLELELQDLYINQGEQAQIIEQAQANLSKAARKPRAPRQPLPKHLPREVQEILPVETDCPSCGGDFVRLGEDVSEVLEHVPAHFKVISIVRPKLACRCCDTIVQAPAPSRPIARGYAGPALLSHVMVSKYLDHLPLYRQSQIYGRQDVDLSDSTLGDWVGGVHILLAPLLEALHQHVFTATKIHTDDTPIKVLAPGNGKTKTARLWVYARDDRPAGSTSPPAVWFAYSRDRQGIHPQTHLKGYKGVLQADAFAGYNEVFKSGEILEAACWAHARRKFHDMHVLNATPITTHALNTIGELYAIEQTIRGKLPAERLKVRQEQSAPIVNALHVWLTAQLATVSKKSITATAIGYALNQWHALTLFLTDGQVEIDNSAAERALRSVAIGRRNFLFLGSDNGGERAATLYSLLGTAKLNGINPQTYLTHVLTVIADHKVNQISELLPWNVKLEKHAQVESETETA